LEQAQQAHAAFEAVSIERLRVIEDGGRLLQDRAAEIARLKERIQELQSSVDETRQQSADTVEAAVRRAAEEEERLTLACREAKRGMEELAARERAQTREILELRNEGLLHSIIRRVRALFA
jgi:hypothetical protein